MRLGILITAPFTDFPGSLVRKKHMAAMSSGGVHFEKSSGLPHSSFPFDRMIVGTRQLAVMPLDLPSSAITLVRAITPALEATYPPFLAEGSSADSAPIDTIAPPLSISFNACLAETKKLTDR